MKEILQKQREYFNTFETYDIKFRTEQLKKLREKILEKKEDLFNAFKEDMNKCEFEVIAAELGLVMNELNYLIKNLKGLAEDRTAASSILNYPAKNFQIFEPYGLTLVVSPWNYPFQLTLVPVIGAISGGNTVIVKPSRNTPNVTRVIKEILSIFPEHYVYVVTDNDEIEDLFDQNFDFICYTGSGKVGRELLARQAKYITPMILELGGKCPCVVSKSANLKAAARRIAFGKFINAGQTCVAPDFLLVDRKVKDKFLAKLIHYVQEFYYKDGVLSEDFVRVINKKALDGILEKVNPNKVVFGGKVDGLTLEPTILDGVTYDDEIMQEEIFGPVLPIIEYDDINDAIEYLRSKPKPLALYYFGKNQKEGSEVLKKCPSGGGCINEVVMHVAEHGLPFGGVGESGIGSYHGAKTFYSFVHAKSVLKRSTWFDFKQKYPPYDEKKVKFAKSVFGIKDIKNAKGKPALAETFAKEEVVVPKEEPVIEAVSTYDEYDMIITPDVEMTLENTVDFVKPVEEVEVITPAEELVAKEEIETPTETVEAPAVDTVETEVDAMEPAEEAPVVLPEIDDVDNDDTEAEQADTLVTEEVVDVDPDEIADIKEQESIIDREPEDFESDLLEENEPEIVEELGDEDDELIDEEMEEIKKIDAELEQLEDDDTDAEQADDLGLEDIEEEPVEETVEEVEETETEPVQEPEVYEETVEPAYVEAQTEEVAETETTTEPAKVEETPVTFEEEPEAYEEPVEEAYEEPEVDEEPAEEVKEETTPVVPKAYSSSWGSVEDDETVDNTYTSEYSDYGSGEEEKPYRFVEPAPKAEEVEEETVEEKPKKTTAKKTTAKKTGTKKATTKKTTTKKSTTKKKADGEEKPKKTTAKKTTKKTTAKKTTTKKAEKELNAEDVKEEFAEIVEKKKKEVKKAVDKNEPKKKETKAKEPKAPKAKTEEKEPKKKALSKKADAQLDAKKAQDDINAMLNMAMPGSMPEKKAENEEDDFLSSLNNLVSKNIETYDDQDE